MWRQTRWLTGMLRQEAAPGSYMRATTPLGSGHPNQGGGQAGGQGGGGQGGGAEAAAAEGAGSIPASVWCA